MQRARGRPASRGSHGRGVPDARSAYRPAIGAWVPAFAAGAAAVIAVHQPVLWIAHAYEFAPWPAYSRTATPPLGVPAVASAAFWGGVWGVPLAVVVRGAPSRRASWARSALFGALGPNAVGALLLALGHGTPPQAGRAIEAAASAVVVNACWGLAAAALLRAWRADGR